MNDLEENSVWEQYARQETINGLRKSLEIDSLPRITNTQLVSDITMHFLSAAQGRKQSSPQLIGFGGGPGAGKSFLYEKMKTKGQLPKNAVLHDPDLVMQSIPQYREDAMSDPVSAFKNWELPARQLAHEILLKALVAGYHIIYIRTFTLPDSLRFAYAVKTFGYTFDMHLVTCDLDVAQTRARERENKTKRHIPPEAVTQRHQAFLRLMPDIIRIADRYFIYENNEHEYVPTLEEVNLEL